MRFELLESLDTSSLAAIAFDISKMFDLRKHFYGQFFGKKHAKSQIKFRPGCTAKVISTDRTGPTVYKSEVSKQQ